MIIYYSATLREHSYKIFEEVGLDRFCLTVPRLSLLHGALSTCGTTSVVTVTHRTFLWIPSRKTLTGRGNPVS
jgi:hypothetical protein